MLASVTINDLDHLIKYSANISFCEDKNSYYAHTLFCTLSSSRDAAKGTLRLCERLIRRKIFIAFSRLGGVNMYF